MYLHLHQLLVQQQSRLDLTCMRQHITRISRVKIENGETDNSDGKSFHGRAGQLGALDSRTESKNRQL